MSNEWVLVCRIQDAEGRGPYRPGFSKYWVEDSDIAPPAPIMAAFPRVMKVAHEIVRHRGGAVGCAFRSLDKASAWFLPGEILTLAKYGYSLCWVRTDEILAENEDQLVIWSAIPFAKAVVATGWKVPA